MEWEEQPVLMNERKNAMFGYKLFFNKDTNKFDYEKDLSEVQYPRSDGTSLWFYNLSRAITSCDGYNIQLNSNMLEVKTCKDCGELFILTRSEKDWLKNNNLKPYARCFSCRKKRREK